MRAFITGINGFAGSHLAAALVNAGHEVWGVSERPEYRGMLPESVPVYLADIRSADSLAQYIAEYEPTHIFHLAGFASPRKSRSEVADCLSINVLGCNNLLEAAAEKAPGARIVAVTSAHIHLPDKQGNVTEKSELDTGSPYAISKVCASHLCRYYYQQRGISVMEARPTNHFGPGQGEGFVVADFASQAARIACGIAEPPIRVGNLDVARDFLYVDDVAQAYIKIAETGVAGEAYCIGSGQPVKISEILEMLVDFSGTEARIETSQDLARPGEAPVISISSAKLNKDTGWKPQTTMEEGLSKTFDCWKEFCKLNS